MLRLSFLLLTCLLAACATPVPEPPNIIFILADDHATKAVGCYGGINETPHLDRLAAEGMRFDRSFCTNGICAPARAVILTGKHSHLNGQLDNRQTFDGSQQTFPKLLQHAGYQTALIGKWHLKSAPTGFDHWQVLIDQGHYYNPVFRDSTGRKQYEGYATNLITDFALDWIGKRDQKKPFCLLYQHKAPHRNWMPDSAHLGMYADKTFDLPETFYDDYATRTAAAREQEMRIDGHMHLDSDLKVPPKISNHEWKVNLDRLNPEQRALWDAAYAAENQAFVEANLEGKALAEWKYQRYIKDYLGSIASVDDNLGRLMDYLEENELAENTVIIYSSDQGFFLGEHGWFDKRFMYEEAFRMPLIVRYPKEIKAGSVCDALVQNLDFGPTMLDLAGVDVPTDMQGRSLRPLLNSAGGADWREAVYYHYYEYPAVHQVKRHYGIRTDRYKLMHFYYDIDAWELYDLQNDPNELNNLYGQPGQESLTADLKQQLTALQVQYRDTAYHEWRQMTRDTLNHLAVGQPVVLRNPPADRYDGGRPDALTDGLYYEDDNVYWNFNWDCWQGFHQEDLVATVDLGEARPIHKVGLHCLQQAGSWIFYPTSVTYYFSQDGVNFFRKITIQNDVPPLKGGSMTHDFPAEVQDLTARYIRVQASNIGTCPEGHHGAGGKAWLFADEIIVE